MPCPSPLRDKVRILVVDNPAFFREGIAAWVARQSGLEYCGCADSPSGALAAIAKEKPDLVLLDLQLRDGSGLDVLYALRAESQTSRVIVISHKDDPLVVTRVLQGGAKGYFLKDEVNDTLLTAIHTVINSGVHLSDHVRPKIPPGGLADLTLPTDRISFLSHRERQVLRKLGRGLSTKEIAVKLTLSPKTVEFYRESLKKKLGLLNSLALVRQATLWEHYGRLD